LVPAVAWLVPAVWVVRPVLPRALDQLVPAMPVASPARVAMHRSAPPQAARSA
jgi:hypothetical protein